MEYTVLIGCGGREHAIANKLFNNTNILTIGNYRNPAIDKLSKKYIVCDLTNDSILEHCRNYIIKYVIIGPEAPLDNKLADEFLKINIPVIGPTFDYAKIETDKHFCRYLLNKYNLNEYSPKYRLIRYKDIDRFDGLFNDIISEIPDFVIKPCKLKSGKGVKVYNEHFNNIDDAKLYIKQLIKFCNSWYENTQILFNFLIEIL